MSRLPIKSKSALFLSSLSLLITLAGVFWFSNNSSTRNPASVFPAPRLKVQPWAHSTDGKLGQAIQVKIYPIGGIPDRDDQELRLRAEIYLNQSMAQNTLEFKWEIPADATLVAGELEDTWTGVHPGQTVQTEISLLNVSKEGLQKRVSLSVFGAVPSGSQTIRMGGGAVFATQNFQAPTSAQTEESSSVPEQNSNINSNSSDLSKDSNLEKISTVRE